MPTATATRTRETATATVTDIAADITLHLRALGIVKDIKAALVHHGIVHDINSGAYASDFEYYADRQENLPRLKKGDATLSADCFRSRPAREIMEQLKPEELALLRMGTDAINTRLPELRHALVIAQSESTKPPAREVHNRVSNSKVRIERLRRVITATGRIRQALLTDSHFDMDRSQMPMYGGTPKTYLEDFLSGKLTVTQGATVRTLSTRVADGRTVAAIEGALEVGWNGEAPQALETDLAIEQERLTALTAQLPTDEELDDAQGTYNTLRAGYQQTREQLDTDRKEAAELIEKLTALTLTIEETGKSLRRQGNDINKLATQYDIDNDIPADSVLMHDAENVEGATIRQRLANYVARLKG